MKSAILSLLTILSLSAVNAQISAPDILPTGKGPLTIQPVLHASLVLSINGLTIYADPNGPLAHFQGIASPDIILITDIHGDHYDPKEIAALRKATTVLVVPKAVADLMPDSLKGKLVILGNGDKTTVSGIDIAAIPMYNLPESPTSMHTKGRGNGYILSIGGKNIYISGDTQGIPEMRALKNIDVAFICMNQPYTMDIKEAADAVLDFKPKIVYPYHYRGKGGLSDVNGFKSLVEAGNKGIEVRLRNWYPQP
jgi:L-ascorbate metabolism protein UlaG (beta-lactamase superfamily)